MLCQAQGSHLCSLSRSLFGRLLFPRPSASPSAVPPLWPQVASVSAVASLLVRLALQSLQSRLTCLFLCSSVPPLSAPSVASVPLPLFGPSVPQLSPRPLPVSGSFCFSAPLSLRPPAPLLRLLCSYLLRFSPPRPNAASKTAPKAYNPHSPPPHQ